MSALRKFWYLYGLRKNVWLNDEQLKKIQEKKLRRIINYAYNNVEYYHKTFNSLGLKPEDVRHVSDLNKRIEQLEKLLKKEGTIFIAVPNIESPDFGKYKDYWAGLDVPRHLYHFTETSIKRLFKQHSLKIVAKYPMKFDAYYVSLLSEKYLGNKFPYLAAFKSGYKSNRYAKKENNYSSMIFVVSE